MNEQQTKEPETFTSKGSWVPIDVVPYSKPLFPQWIWHILLIVSVFGLLAVVLVARYPKKKNPKISMIRTQLNILLSASVGKPLEPTLHPKEDRQLSKDDSKPSISVQPILQNNTKKHDSQNFQTKRSHKKTAKVTSPIKQETIEESMKEELRGINPEPRSVTSSPVYVSPLEKIRKDTKRLYMDRKFSVGDLVFEIRNVSEYGLELYVENSADARKTYYFPKVTVEGSVSNFEGTVLEPGKGSFGWLIVPNIKEKEKLKMEFSVVGGERKKESVKLKW